MFVGQKGGGGGEGWLATQATSSGSTPDHGFKIWRSYQNKEWSTMTYNDLQWPTMTYNELLWAATS